MKQIYHLGVWLVLSTLFLKAEPSVYGLGGSFVSKKEIISLKKSMTQLRQKELTHAEKIEGLNSLIEGFVNSINLLEQDNKRLQSRVEAVELTLKKQQEYLLESKNHQSLEVEKEVVKPISKNLNSDKSMATIYKEGVTLFTKRRFSQSKEKFLFTDTKGYKLAPTNYYLGEISYYTKAYSDAIFYFKKSSGFNENAGYMGTLILHTAISLDKTGEKAKAKQFYENVIANYRGKRVAKIAQERLKKL